MDEITKTPDMSELMANGQPRFKTLANGAIRDQARRRIVKGAKLTSEQGRALGERRTSLARERTRAGIAEGLGLDLTKASGGGEWQELTKIMVERFRESTNIRGLGEVYAQLGKAAGYTTPEAEAGAVESIAAALLQLFDRLDRGVIEGRVIE